MSSPGKRQNHPRDNRSRTLFLHTVRRHTPAFIVSGVPAASRDAPDYTIRACRIQPETPIRKEYETRFTALFLLPDHRPQVFREPEMNSIQAEKRPACFAESRFLFRSSAPRRSLIQPFPTAGRAVRFGRRPACGRRGRNPSPYSSRRIGQSRAFRSTRGSSGTTGPYPPALRGL